MPLANADASKTDESITELIKNASDKEANKALSEPASAEKYLLRDGFARTLSPQAQIAQIFESPMRQLKNPGWLKALEKRAALAKLHGVARHQATQVSQLSFDIPLADHPFVDVYIEYFTGKGRWFFEKWLKRADIYIPIMRPILKKKGLPEDTVYLAMIESGFSSRARSTVGAGGFWQFMPATGKVYGLSQTTWVDERRDFIMATESAAHFLTDLHREFKDWHLAWAGYNAGGGRIRRALKRHGATTFWDLADNPKSLVQETRHYVPKIIAAAIVAKNREKYGFAPASYKKSLSWDEFQVESSTDLRIVAKYLHIPITQLRTLNPAYFLDITPPNKKSTLRVPKGKGLKTQEWIASLPAKKRNSYQRHTLKKGETLYALAARYNTKMEIIRDFNDIQNPRSLRPGDTLIIPTKAAAARAKSASKTLVASRSKKKSTQKSHTRKHKVSRGETLWSIATRYGVSVADLKSNNRNASNNILVGQIIQLPRP